MPLSTVAIPFDISDKIGTDYDARRTKAWVTTNAETIIDTDGNLIRVGSGTTTVAADGTGTFNVWVPGTGSNPDSWQTTFHFSVPDRNAPGGRLLLDFGPYTVTVAANLADLVEEQEVPPTYLSTVTDQLDTYVDSAAAASTAAAASATSAAASAALAAAIIDAPAGPPGADGADGATGPAGPTWASINAQTGTAFTATQADETTLVTLTNAGAITVTLPASLSIGTRIDFAVLGAGMATFAGSGGATITATPSSVTRATGSTVSAAKLTSTVWLVAGDLA